MARTRVPFDVNRLSRGNASGHCFICDCIKGNPDDKHVVVAETDTAIAFLNRFPTLFGYVLVAPKDHREQVTGDFSEDAYIELQRFVYKVAEAVRNVLAPERVYILSLGSQAANSHVHWHIAPLPEGVPLEQQQYYALMHENGVVETTHDEMVQYGEKLRTAIEKQ